MRAPRSELDRARDLLERRLALVNDLEAYRAAGLFRAGDELDRVLLLGELRRVPSLVARVAELELEELAR